jgi:hypothetical protein
MTNMITVTSATTVYLNMAADNPTTVTSTGLLTGGLSVSYSGLAVVNAGSITANAVGFGIEFLTAGRVTNQSGGVIGSGDEGIQGLYAAVTVVNAGSIAGGDIGGIVLSAGGSVTNQSGGAISGGHYGIQGLGAAVTVVNAGGITASRNGVFLNAGGSVTNQSGGAISGYHGIYGKSGAVTVVNAGGITASNDGVVLLAGGSVTNQRGGAISGINGIVGAYAAVTVVNAGTITGSSDAVKFAAGFANRLVIDPGAVFSGTVTGGNAIGATQVSTLELASAGSAGTLSGLGTQFVDFAQVTVDAGARWTLTGANTLAAGYTLTDAGSLTNAGPLSVDSALTLAPGGVLLNGPTGTITASDGNAVYGAPGGAATVGNAGVIAGDSDGIVLDAGGSVTNQRGAAISGGDGIYGKNASATVVNGGGITASGYGVFLDAGGSVTNQIGGTISGGVNGIVGKNATATVVNAGSIAGGNATSGYGVFLDAGGSVTNQRGGAISGLVNGIAGENAALTLVNAGTITGSTDAVKFAAGYANRLVIDPGAEFSGTVTGGNAIGAGQVSTLELASAGSAGTLSGLGAKYVDFAQVTVDAGAQFTLAGADTIESGVTMTNAGTLSGRVTLAAGGVFSNASTGTISVSSGNAVYGAAGGAATVVNAGVIADTDASGDRGIDLAAGGSVTNQSGGSISGHDGIVGYNAAVTMANAGTIAAYVGALLFEGGSVTNQSGGAISGGLDGIEGQGAAVTVVNAGTIAGSNGEGILLFAGGSVTNRSGGAISGGGGIEGQGGAVTVENAGTIAGSNYAVKFAAGSTNRLIADPGAVFTGNVNGGGGVLELASAASTGTLSGLGTGITNFSALQFDAGAAWTVSGNDSASGLGTIAITGFADGDTIDLIGFLADSETFSNNTLVLTDTGGAQDTLSIQGTFTSGSFQLSADASRNGTDIVVVCFCAGTMIGTPAGEVPVEKLNIGDRVLTAQNGPRLVKWIGNGKVLATRGRRTAATPVIVRKGALAGNVPKADLRVTKAHSLYIDDVLIPVEFLVNHRTILWDDHAGEVEIYHVELDSHDVLIANGALAESFRDDGNRWLFHNARSGWNLPPQEPYAPVLTGGPIVDAVWQRLLDRAPARPAPALIADPDLNLLVDGVRLDPAEQRGTALIFRLANRPHSVRVVSRAASPAELGLARDPRRLGVAVTRIAVGKGWRLQVMEASDATLSDGFHDFEPALGLRWTDGDAALPVALFEDFDGAMTLTLHLSGSTRYPALPQAVSQVAA